VAKTRFEGAPAIEVCRGRSTSPLFVTAVGVAPEEVAERVRSMHGAHRVPTLLKRVDRLARST
jgi:deoxyribonuclease V